MPSVSLPPVPDVRVQVYAVWPGPPSLRDILALRECVPDVRGMTRGELLRLVRQGPELLIGVYQIGIAVQLHRVAQARGVRLDIRSLDG